MALDSVLPLLHPGHANLSSLVPELASEGVRRHKEYGEQGLEQRDLLWGTVVGVRIAFKCGNLDPGWKAQLQFNLEFYFLALGAGN